MVPEVIYVRNGTVGVELDPVAALAPTGLVAPALVRGVSPFLSRLRAIRSPARASPGSPTPGRTWIIATRCGASRTTAAALATGTRSVTTPPCSRTRRGSPRTGRRSPRTPRVAAQPRRGPTRSPLQGYNGDCKQVTIGVTAPAGGISTTLNACETWEIAKGNPAVTFALAWIGPGTRSSRGLDYEISVSVPQGGWPQWSLPAETHGRRSKMPAVTRSRVAFAVCAWLLVGACQGTASGGGIPSTAEAGTFLNQLVAYAQQGDFDHLCAVGDLNCADELSAVGRDSVPSATPRILGSRTIAPTNANGQQTVGGIVLTVCGVDGRSRPYRSEVLVFRTGATLAAINSIYWDDITIGDGATAVTPSGPPPTDPADPRSSWPGDSAPEPATSHDGRPSRTTLERVIEVGVRRHGRRRQCRRGRPGPRPNRVPPDRLPGAPGPPPRDRHRHERGSPTGSGPDSGRP